MSNKKKKIEYKTLLTVIATGATPDAQELLKKNGYTEAKDAQELRSKLAECYTKSADKIGMEKEMARIHPHSKFILKHLAPKIDATPETKDEPKPEVKILDNGSNFEGSENGCKCKCRHCKTSSFDGAEKEIEKSKPEIKLSDSMSIIALVAVIGFGFYALTKANK